MRRRVAVGGTWCAVCVCECVLLHAAGINTRDLSWMPSHSRHPRSITQHTHTAFDSLVLPPATAADPGSQDFIPLCIDKQFPNESSKLKFLLILLILLLIFELNDCTGCVMSYSLINQVLGATTGNYYRKNHVQSCA